MKFAGRAPAWTGLFACLALAGCATQNNPYPEYFQLMKASIADTFNNGAITRDQAAAIPYATIGYRVNDGRENMLVLATDTNGDLLWTAASHVVLVTHDGRIIRTVGLPDNIASVTPSLSSTIPPPALARKNAFTGIRSADFPDESRYSVPINCKTVSRGSAIVTILGKKLATVRVDETCENEALGWSFRDSYWVDAQTGFVWRAIQHLTPKGETIEIEILRPPG